MATGAGGPTLFIRQQCPIATPLNDGLMSAAQAAAVAAGGSGTAFNPAQALFVSLAWPVGSNPLIYFTSIQAALNQAATMGPTDVNPISIQIFPGTYNENLTLVSNVSLFGFGRRVTQINGTVTWTAGAGINASQAAIHEEVDIFYLKMLSTLSVNTTAKKGSGGLIDLRDLTVIGGSSFVGRPTGADGFNSNSCILEGSNLSTDMNGNIMSSDVDEESGTFTINGVSGNGVAFYGSQVLINMTIEGSNSFASLIGCEYFGDVSVANTCSFFCMPCTIDEGSTIAVASGGLADVRGSEYGIAGTDITFTGPGPIDRSQIQLASGSTGAGANAITISPPLPDANYTVSVTQTSAAGGAMPSITAKAGGGFTLNDAAGSRTFDLTVLRQ